MADIVKMTTEELAKCKLKDITSVVKAKFTEEELQQLKEVTEEIARRELVILLYEKYIDEVIAEQNGTDTVTLDDTQSGTTGTVTADNGSTAETNGATVASNKTVVDANINVYYTVTVRGITGYNGTITTSSEKLLTLAFKNSKSFVFIFHTTARAKQFIETVKAAKRVKGLSTISETTRALVIKRLKDQNGVK